MASVFILRAQLRGSTGYINIRDVHRELFGADVIDRTGQVWGMDEEGEICGSYRPSGYPGVSSNFRRHAVIIECHNLQLWYATGDFYNARFLSKHLVRDFTLSTAFITD